MWKRKTINQVVKKKVLILVELVNKIVCECDDILVSHTVGSAVRNEKSLVTKILHFV